MDDLKRDDSEEVNKIVKEYNNFYSPFYPIKLVDWVAELNHSVLIILVWMLI